MQVKFATVAEGELDDAILYYEAAVEGLGTRFRNEVERAAIQLGRMPMLWPEV